MTPIVLLTAALYVCLGAPVLSVMIVPPPRKHGGFSFPPGKLILPGKRMKMKIPILRPVPLIPMPLPSPVLKRFPTKHFLIMKKIKKTPFHLHMMHKMLKVKKMKKMKKMAWMSLQRALPVRLRPAPWGGSFRRTGSRSGGYGQRFRPQTATLGRRSGSGYGKRQRVQNVDILQPFQRAGAISGIQGTTGFGGRPIQTFGTRRPAFGQAFQPANQALASQRTGQNFGTGFQGGNFGNHFRTLDDIDIFDRSFDDRFDRGFEMDDIIDDDIRDSNEDFRDSLEVPDIFDDGSGLGHHTVRTASQTSTRSDGYYNRRRWQQPGHGLIGHDDDDISRIQAHVGANIGSAAAQGFNPFNVQPGFLQGHTGVNAGGGIGILQNTDHVDDVFDDTGKHQPVSVSINFNAMNPIVNNGQFDASQGLPVGQTLDGVDDGKIDVEVTGVQGGVSPAGAHIVAEKGDADDTMIVPSGVSGHGVHSDSQINGVEMLGHSHPNMLANTGFWETDRDNDMHGGHPQSMQQLPFNPLSDDNLQMTDSLRDELGKGSLEMLGIDPRTLDNGVMNGHFSMQSSVATATSPPPHAHFAEHQPTPLSEGIFNSVDNPMQFPGLSFDQQPEIPSDISFISTIDQNPSQPILAPPATDQFGHQSSPQGGAVSPVFQDISMNGDMFHQDFGPLDKPADHSGGVQSTHTGHQQATAHQFTGAGGQADDLSLLPQIPSLNDLAFGMDQFSGHAQ